MLRLRDIMTRDVVTVSPDLSLRDAMDLLSSRHISGAPVSVRGKVVGVVSLTDLAEFAASTPGVPTHQPELEEWAEYENSGDCPDGDDFPAAVFFAEQWDDAGADVVERMETPSSPEWNALDEHTVAEAMNRSVLALSPDALVEYAATVMRHAAIHRVFVMDNDALLGVVTTKDISNAVADHRFSDRVVAGG